MRSAYVIAPQELDCKGTRPLAAQESAGTSGPQSMSDWPMVMQALAEGISVLSFHAPLSVGYRPEICIERSDIDHSTLSMHQECRSELGHLQCTDGACQILSCPFATLIVSSLHA